MEKNIDDHFLIIQYLIGDNKQYTDDLKNTLKKYDSGFTKIKTVLKQLMVQNQNFSPDKVDSPKVQDPDTLVLANKRSPPLEGVYSMKSGVM